MGKYYIGLDIGTDAIGWAATNTVYQLLKCKGNAMWGIRLLDNAETATERRVFRSARRRQDRKEFRIACLQMLFRAEIDKQDITFFQRLKESNLWFEDKSCNCKYTLFHDAHFTDKDFHKTYPTVYHLRKALIENSAPHDVRLLYLAISHIIKHRGHFLFDSDFSGSENNQIDFADIWNAFSAYCRDNYNIDFFFEDTNAIAEILKNTKDTKLTKKKNLADLLSVSAKIDPEKLEIIQLLTGGTATASKLFQDESLKDSECKKVCISSGYDEKIEQYESTFGEKAELLAEIKAVYDWTTLANILNGQPYLSAAKVAVYEQHKTDLQRLKAYVKAYCPEKRDIIFNENKKATKNYVAYSKHRKNGSPEGSCTQEEFCKFVKSQLPNDCAAPDYADMYARLENGTFMPKASSKENAVIPMQIHKQELCTILQNAEEYFPFLLETDESGKTVSQKILDIFSFRIPYYVGPLNPHSERHWLCRSDEKIYPWNFESVVDTEQSAEKFITTHTSKCTYLPQEDVLAKHSLLYSSFMVLNALNNVKIDGNKLPISLKQEIYTELFLKRNTVKQKSLVQFLESKGYTNFTLTGIDGDFKVNLKSYLDFKNIPLSAQEKEEIICAITIFGEDKNLLKKRIQKQFGKSLTGAQIQSICRMKYSGWGRLSKKFLIGIEGVVRETGVVCNIMYALWETQKNLMQILSQENTFAENIEKENSAKPFPSLKAKVDNLYVSPKIKRPIYQTMQIVEELVKLRGYAPEKIFVEVARGSEEKKRTVSRKQRLEELYKAAKMQSSKLYTLLESYNQSELRKDALYLYFTQFGKCMYTGKDLDISDIYDKNICDIDHIYPRSKIKDDSLDNRVLVLKTINAEKNNVYPIKPEIRQNMQDFWKMLYDKKIISATKYERLTRYTPLSDEELAQFINRQLVETRQSTKAVAELLKRRYPETEIVYVKAGLVSDFRHDAVHRDGKKTDPVFVKCRDVNDLHHAKDAYLNIVVGNVYNTQFNHNKARFIQGLQSGQYSVKKMFHYPIPGAWVAQNEESFRIVRETVLKNNIRFTRQATCKKGGLFDQQPLKKGHGQVSLKANSPRADIQKYGGYNSPSSTYFCLVSAVQKGSRIKIIIPVDLYRETEYQSDPKAYVADFLLRTYEGTIQTDSVDILIPKIKYNTLICVNGFRMHISSKSSGGTGYICKPAMQLLLGAEQEDYIQAIRSYLQQCSQNRRTPELTAFDVCSESKNIQLYDAICEKLTKTIFQKRFAKLSGDLLEKQEAFAALPFADQCEILMEILAILHANARTGNLKKLGKSGNSGSIKINAKIQKSQKLKSFKIIHQSITGLYETEIELLDDTK